MDSPPGPIHDAIPSPLTPWRAFTWTVANFEEVVTAILLAIMLVSVGLGVFFRYVLNAPLSWTEEIVLLCLVWTVFLGASLATKHHEHIVIDIVLALVPKRLARAMETLGLILTVGLLGLIAWQGVLLLQVTQFITTTALNIPTMYMYAAVPASAVLMLIHNLRLLYQILRYGWGG